MTKHLSKKHHTELLNLAQSLNTATSPQQAGEIITETAAKLLGWDSCYIHLGTEKMELLFPIINMDTIDGQRMAVDSGYRGDPPSAFFREVIEHGAKLLLKEPPFSFRPGAIPFGDTARPSASLMFVPLRHANKVIGIFSVQSYAPNAYDENDLVVLQSLADHCGGALERIRTTEDLRVAKEQLDQHANELEDRINERTAELGKTISSLESFCYTIAHDLRAPLRSVQGFARFLLEDYSDKLDNTGQDYCRRIATSANNMDHLIRDLLLYGQLAHKELPLENVELEDLINDVLAELDEEIKIKAACVDVKKPLPHIFGNATVVEQALNNLITNALKFTDKNTTPLITIRTELLNDKVRLYVEDNGIGIEPEYHERIFQVFERLHDSSTYPGTGIGLAIVRKGIERIGGQVGLESQVGQGSTFWLELVQAKDHP